MVKLVIWDTIAPIMTSRQCITSPRGSKELRTIMTLTQIEIMNVNNNNHGINCVAGIILRMYPANVRRRYNVTPSLIGWALTQNDLRCGVI